MSEIPSFLKKLRNTSVLRRWGKVIYTTFLQGDSSKDHKRTKKCCGVSKKRKINFEINQKDFIEHVVIGVVFEQTDGISMNGQDIPD